MPCYSPIRGVLVGPPGGRSLRFERGVVGKAVSLPCGKCLGCKLERSRQWAVRIVHEAKMHEASAFITLTFSPEHLPKDASLSVETCQLFLKRLRARVAPTRIRFFLCGEYGEQFGRPHYHAIIFGFDFPDKVPLKRSGEFALYESKLLSDTWGLGFASIGEVSFDSAAYVASYATKKILTNREDEAKRLKGRRPEFLLMSRRPGIGRAWIDKFASDVYPSDEIISRGVSARPPRYYDQVLEVKDPALLLELKAKREAKADELERMVLASGEVVEVAPSRNARRLAVRETVAKAKASLKRRKLESETNG